MKTARLHQRPFAGDDAAAIHRVYNDPELMRHVAGGPVADLAGTEASYTLGRQWRGRGYATEAAGAWLRAAFEQFDLDGPARARSA